MALLPALADPSAALLAAVDAVLSAVAAVPTSVEKYRCLEDAAVIEAMTRVAAVRDAVAARASILAAELTRRSDPRLGGAGLARRAGHRTPERLLQSVTRASGGEASTAVRLGRLITEAADGGDLHPTTGELAPSSHPWLSGVAARLASGDVSAGAAEAIRRGLGSSSSDVSVAQLAAAAAELCVEAASADPDTLFRRARERRDELDAAGIGLREEQRRQQRSLRLAVLPSGMGRLTWDIDPETLATVKDVYDRMTSPKLGGVRFVDPDARDRAEGIAADPRTPAQIASDGFAQLLRIGADANPRFLLGSGAPVVTVLVTRSSIEAREGFGRIEGEHDPVSIETVERLRCEGATVGLVFDENLQPLDLGREHRFFSRRQRAALAAQQGGCMAPGCDRPPAWCEIHHMKFWARDHGSTNLRDGILLCRHHHLEFHNGGWEIERDDDGLYWLIPPVGIDSARTPRPMPTRSAALRDLARETLRDAARDAVRDRGGDGCKDGGGHRGRREGRGS